MGEVRHCGLCGSHELSPLLDLGSQPLAEDFAGTGKRYPLALNECANCGLVQLSHMVDQELVFTPAHPYASGNTAALRDHFMRLAAEGLSYMQMGDLAVDIGANDGTLLEGFHGHGVRLAGVEPTGQAAKMALWGVHTYQEFFTEALAAHIKAEHGPAKLITACNVMAHVPGPHDFMNGVGTLLARDGLLIAENHDVASVTEGLQIDTVYHEHLRYWSPETFARLLGLHNFRVVSVTPIPTHGGSFRVLARKNDGRALGTRASQALIKLHAMVRRAAEEGPVYGISAATRAVPVLHAAGLAEYISCVCEVATSEKIGKTMPGTLIPVVDEKRLIEDQPPHALLFAWHLAASLIPKLRSAGYRGKFIIPLPEPRIADG